MAINYWFILSLLEVLLLTNWIHSASLNYPLHNEATDHENSSAITSKYSTSEKFAHVQSPLIKRQKRWILKVDHDEIENTLDKFLRSLPTSTEAYVSDTTIASLDFPTKESKPSMIEDELFNTTESIQMNATTVEMNSNENSTIHNSLFEQISTQLHQTDDQIITSNNNTIETSSPINLFDGTTMSENVTDNNQTMQWGLLFNDKTETISYNDSSTMKTNDELIINANEIIVNTEKVNFNGTLFLPSQSMNMSLCDRSCQCLQKCPYDFDIINNTCICHPPCQNYQCFGNDTCIVTEDGKQLCQSTDNDEHVRPTRCYQPRHSGYHDIQIEYYNRWYYNPDQNACHLFVYRGLGGNENNFKTLRDCHLECIICSSLPDPGECFGHINMWYYDNKQHQCQQFEYSGCKGNENKFSTEEQCIQTCIKPILDLP